MHRVIVICLLLPLVHSPLVSAPPGSAPTDGLIGYWPLDGDANDESGNGNHGIVYGATPTEDQQGNPDSAYFFDGIDDYIDVGGSPILKPPLPMTLAGWLRWDEEKHAFMFLNDFQHNRYYGVFLNLPGNIRRLTLSYGDGGTTTVTNRRTKRSNGLLEMDHWYHLAGVIRGAMDMDLYINGHPADGYYEGSGGPLAYSPDGHANIGRGDSSSGSPPWYAHGVIDEVYFYDRSLTSAEVSCVAYPLDNPDGDAWCGPIDLCPNHYSATNTDTDGDSYGDVCDNCPELYNPSQQDSDADNEGDHCDLDDGLIYLFLNHPDWVEWQDEEGFDLVAPWNCYKGDLEVLKSTGVYTQAPGSNDLALRHCGLNDPWVDDYDIPAMGKCAHFLVTGMQSGIENGLGDDSNGSPRPNDNPCP